MNTDLVHSSTVTPLYTAKGKVNGYQCELWHEGLGEHCVLKASDPSILENKVLARQHQWSSKWERITEKRQIAASHQASAEDAEQRTRAAEQELANARTLLVATLTVNDAVNWESLKDHSVFVFRDRQRFPKVQFDQRGQPTAAAQQDLPPEPPRHAPRFQPTFSLLDRLFASRKTQRRQEAEQRYTTAMQQWRAECQAVESANQQNQTMLQAATVAYQTAARAFQARQREANEKVEQLRARYVQGAAEAVVQNCELVLNASVYPDFVSKNFTVTYNAEARLLVVDYSLPAPAAMPTLVKVTYLKARQELKETHLTDKQHQLLYDEVLYQMTLRTLHELFEADTAQALASIVFNGWVEEINQATGHRENACILTVQVNKHEFMALNLSQIDPKACFKKLKGIAASTLSGLTPVPPLVQLKTEDERFVPSYNVAQNLDQGTNLAVIDWKDFEHLVRELFEKEFASSGAEVKVTRASADGGVDAVIFDPDPIRGGKIVIQAKRYTNTVDVAAVRDLYGTVMNEGANKGILVTTSDYGPDAYSFIRDKPLTLLNGANLLHLLSKHGHRARIDIREEKALRK